MKRIGPFGINDQCSFDHSSSSTSISNDERSRCTSNASIDEDLPNFLRVRLPDPPSPLFNSAAGPIVNRVRDKPFPINDLRILLKRCVSADFSASVAVTWTCSLGSLTPEGFSCSRSP